ncbi:MAG: hypothetical protein OEU26_07200 [Candidatus Tectomicrobia bacterium]|nr:hypothetical protein [Candidatus Tectomicrobia bacterium]
MPKDGDGKAEIHYTTIYKVFAKWADDGSLEHAFIGSVGYLSDHNRLDLSVLHGDGINTVAKKGGDGIGFSGYQHQKGEKVIAIIDNHGYVLSLLPVAPVNEADTVLLPEGLRALKRVAKRVGLDLNKAYLNLDGGFDSKSNRKVIFNAGLIPNINENPRNRKTTKRGRKRLFNKAIHRFTRSSGADVCMGGQIQAVAAPFRIHPAVPLRDEGDGLYTNQFEAVLLDLKLPSNFPQGAARQVTSRCPREPPD